MLGTAPLSNSWMIILIWLYIALNRTPNVDCCWVEAVPKSYGSFLTFWGREDLEGQLTRTPIWGFPKIKGIFSVGPYNKDYSIFGSILGSPYLGKLPYVAVVSLLFSIVPI